MEGAVVREGYKVVGVFTTEQKEALAPLIKEFKDKLDEREAAFKAFHEVAAETGVTQKALWDAIYAIHPELNTGEVDDMFLDNENIQIVKRDIPPPETEATPEPACECGRCTGECPDETNTNDGTPD